MAEEYVSAKVDSLKKLFTANGAEFIADEAPDYIGLAYTMIHKVNNKNLRINSAYFGWFKFKSDPEILEKVKMTLDRDTDLVRFLLIKTVAESTLAPKKLSQKRDVRKKFGGNDVVATEIATEATGEVGALPVDGTVEAEPVMLSEDMADDVMAEVTPEDLIEIADSKE